MASKSQNGRNNASVTESVPAMSVTDGVTKQPKPYTRDEVSSFLSEIARNVISSSGTHIHSVIALNQILRAPEAEQIFDADLKEQARDLWLKLKSTGLQLIDPPLLFGAGVAIPPEFDLDDQTPNAG